MNINNDFCSLNTNLNLDTNINEVDEFIKRCCNKIKNILGEDFELSYLDKEKDEVKNKKILNFKFVNKSGIKNSLKYIYIYNKIQLLKKNNFIEIEDLKLSGIGRFIKIHIKTIFDYENEKLLLLNDFTNKIKLIDEKIKRLQV